MGGDKQMNFTLTFIGVFGLVVFVWYLYSVGFDAGDYNPIKIAPPPPAPVFLNRLKLTSPALTEGQEIPKKYTCKGENVNPPLNISGVSENTKSLLLIMDDLDAPLGTFTHWLVYNIPPQTKIINENALPEGAVSGQNSYGKSGYSGPCPPLGMHKYYFKLYALDTTLTLPDGATKKQIENLVMPHLIDKGELMRTYTKTFE